MTTSQSGFVTSGQNQIYYTATGKGKPVVLIHGGGVDHYMWQPQVAALSKRFQVITYDLRGHGQSEYNDNELKDLEDLLAILEALNLEKVHIVGLSLGAIIAVDFVLAHPDKVDKMVLISPGLAGYQEQDSTYLQPIIKLGGALQNGETTKAAEIVSEMTFQGLRPRELPSYLDTAVDYVKNSFIRYMESGNFTRIPQLEEPVPVNRLNEIQAPVKIIHGAEDALYIKNNMYKLDEELKESRVAAIPHAAHLLNVEKPEETNYHIYYFLK